LSYAEHSDANRLDLNMSPSKCIKKRIFYTFLSRHVAPALHTLDPARFDDLRILRRLNIASRALAELKGLGR